MKQIIAIMVIVMVFAASTTLADECMRYNNGRVCPGDSIFDAISLFGEPDYKSDVGEVTGPLGSRNVELWIYQHKMWRWELTVVSGRIMVIKKIRLCQVR